MQAPSSPLTPLRHHNPCVPYHQPPCCDSITAPVSHTTSHPAVNSCRPLPVLTLDLSSLAVFVPAISSSYSALGWISCMRF